MVSNEDTVGWKFTDPAKRSAHFAKIAPNVNGYFFG
jgi:hypothetical protein